MSRSCLPGRRQRQADSSSSTQPPGQRQEKGITEFSNLHKSDCTEQGNTRTTPTITRAYNENIYPSTHTVGKGPGSSASPHTCELNKATRSPLTDHRELDHRRRNSLSQAEQTLKTRDNEVRIRASISKGSVDPTLQQSSQPESPTPPTLVLVCLLYTSPSPRD